jgi:hypothetical protein
MPRWILELVELGWDASLEMHGVFLAGRSITKLCCVDPTTTEALAAIHAVLFAKEQSFRHTIFEGETKRVV